MKYNAKFVGRSDYRGLFLPSRIYDDRRIQEIAKRHGLRLTRPNGSNRYRGSRRLVLTDPKTKRIVWNFDAFVYEDAPTKILPEPIGFLGLYD